MGFSVKVGDQHYVKRTSRFGAFHGSVVLTESEREARVWTREKDAKRAAWAVGYHRKHYRNERSRNPLPEGEAIVLPEPS